MSSSSLISHRFRPINKHSISEVALSQLYFCPTDKLNDPYDCQIDLEVCFKNAMEKSGIRTADNGLLSHLQEKVKEIGVVCFSEKLAHPVMWSHYSDNHRGVCFTYNIPNSFIEENSPEILGWDSSTYNNNKVTNKLIELLNKHCTIEELIPCLFTTKAKEWRYEKEFRIIKATPGIFKIPQEFLKQICFGLRTSHADIELICKTAESAGYKDIVFAQMKRNSGSDFGFKAEKLDLSISK